MNFKKTLRLILSLITLVFCSLTFANSKKEKLNIQIPSYKGECVQIYYDQTTDPNYWIGRTYSLFLQNILGHFPEFQQIVSPIEKYQKGQIEKCHTSFYLGSSFNNKIPPEFFEDFAKTSKNVVWMGYNHWEPGTAWFDNLFGYHYEKMTTLNKELLDSKGRPTFFKDVLYKGETFFKFGEWSLKDPTQFLAGFEVSQIKKSEKLTPENQNTQVLAEIVHNGTGQKLPYILRNKNKFFVADIPFSFMHEADRYLVFSDVLFDTLDAKPRHNGKYAMVRMEDVYPMIQLYYTYEAMNVLKEQNVPIHISLIPIFVDPLKRLDTDTRFLSMEDSIPFKQFIKDAQKNDANFIWHGITHQYSNKKNPHTGVSSEDFEFWDAVNNKAIPEDSVPWVLRRMQDGLRYLNKQGIDFVGWLTPHYQASVTDYLLFGRIFEWNFGRAIYFDFDAKGLDLSARDPKILMNNKDPRAAQARLEAFSALQVTTRGPWNGQLFPYEIYGDVYGQRMIPENLGNSQPYRSDHVVWPRSIESMLADASRNRVIRDSWGSFFYHSYLFSTVTGGGRGVFPGDSRELKRILIEMKKMGYQFISMKNFMESVPAPMRPEPIYIK